MKKSTKSTPPSSRKSQTPRVKRHTSGKAKPVTIELTAETVEAKATSNTDSSTKTETAPSRSKSRTGTPVEKEKSAGDKKREVKTGNQFGRDFKETNKESSNGPDPVSEKTKPKRAPSTLSLNLNRFAAALIGGCVALGGAGLFQYLGLLAPPNSTARFVDQDKYSAETKALREELVALKKLQQAQSQTLRSETDIAAINERIDSKIAETALQVETAEIEKIVGASA